MQTAIVIVNYNDYKSVKSLIDNVKDYKIIDRIVVVDNNSNEDEKKQLKKIRNKKVKMLYLEENKGYAYAINEGCRYLISECGKCNIIISNPDIIINSEKDIKELLKTLLKKNIAISAPVIFENNTLNRGWRLPKPIDDIMFNIPYFGKKYHKKHLLYKDDYYKEDIVKVDVVSGCFFLIRSTILKEINFLDENTFLYYEENILSKKIKELNKDIVINNNVLVVHNHSVTIDKNVNRINKYKMQKKSQYYFEKEYNKANGFELFMLKLTSNVTKIVLSIWYKIK